MKAQIACGTLNTSSSGCIPLEKLCNGSTMRLLILGRSGPSHKIMSLLLPNLYAIYTHEFYIGV